MVGRDMLQVVLASLTRFMHVCVVGGAKRDNRYLFFEKADNLSP